MPMPEWNAVQWKMPGTSSCTAAPRLGGLPGVLVLAVPARRLLRLALLLADHLAQLVERALEALHERPRVAHQVAVAHEPEVDVVAVAHHRHVEPDAVRHDRHREVRL